MWDTSFLVPELVLVAYCDHRKRQRFVIRDLHADRLGVFQTKYEPGYEEVKKQTKRGQHQ